MTAPRDDLEEDVRARLRELFEVLETTRQGAVSASGEPTEQGTVLRVLGTHLYPALNRKVTDSAGSGAVTWHLAHMACDVVDSVPMRGPAFRPVREANKQLKTALTAARIIQETKLAEDLEELKALVRAVVPNVLGTLDPTLHRQHDMTLEKLGDVQQAVGEVPGNVQTTLAPAFTTVQQAVGEVPGNVQTTLAPAFTTVQQAVGEVPGNVQTTLAPAFDDIECHLKELPQNLSSALINSLPAAVAAVVAALKPQPVQPPPPVIIQVTFADLGALAAAQPSTYTTSAAQRIVFLQAAYAVLQSAVQSNQLPTPAQLAQITTVVLGVLNYLDPNLSPTDLSTITTLKQQIAACLSSLALAVAGGN